MKKYIVTKTVEVEAETPEEAIQKVGSGRTISFSVMLPMSQSDKEQAGKPPV